MKIAAAQTQPTAGKFDQNLADQVAMVHQAADRGADLIIFPELSLTGYEPKKAAEWAVDTDDARWDSLAELSSEKKIIIATGAPVRRGEKVLISMPVFFPNGDRKFHDKYFIHESEEAFFSRGNDNVFWSFGDEVIYPAICYESTVREYADRALSQGATLLAVSNAKTEESTKRSNEVYKKFSLVFGLTIIVSNSVGKQNGNEIVGKSTLWLNGAQLAELDDKPGLLIFDNNTFEVKIHSS